MGKFATKFAKGICMVKNCNKFAKGVGWGVMGGGLGEPPPASGAHRGVGVRRCKACCGAQWLHGMAREGRRKPGFIFRGAGFALFSPQCDVIKDHQQRR